MNFNYNTQNYPEKNDIYISNPNREIICSISDMIKDDITIIRNANDLNQLSFTVEKFADNSDIYGLIQENMYLFVENEGYFVIENSPETKDENSVSKKIEANSIECELQRKSLRNWKINCGTNDSLEYLADDNIDETGLVKEYITVYNSSNNQLSLLDLVLEKTEGNWSVGYVDRDIANQRFMFDIDSQDIFSFLTQEFSKTTNCICKFNTIEKTLNVYKIEHYGQDTGIFVDFVNLLKNIEIKPDTENIQTRYYVSNNNFDIGQINFGDNYIENIDYYINARDENGDRLYVSGALACKYEEWKEYVESRRQDYIDARIAYNELEQQIYDLKYKLPNDYCATDWSSYSTEELLETQQTQELLFKKLLEAYRAEWIESQTDTDKSLFLYDSTENSGIEITGYTGSSSTVVIPKYINDLFGAHPVVGIADEAFSGNTTVEEVIIKDNLTYIGQKAFYNCSNLKSIVLPSTIQTIKAYAFTGTAITDLSIDSIQDEVILQANSLKMYALKSIYINKVKNIPSLAFFGNGALEKVYIDSSIEKISQDAFEQCANLDTIYINKPQAEVTTYENSFPSASTVLWDYFISTLNILDGLHYIKESEIRNTIYWSDYYCYKYIILQNILIELSNRSTSKGDVNCDGVVNETDLMLIKNYIVQNVGLTPQGILNADMNNDSVVDIQDVILLRNKISGDYNAYKTDYKTEWELYGTVELQNKITAYKSQIEAYRQAGVIDDITIASLSGSTSTILGDVNGDGIIDTQDKILMSQYIVNNITLSEAEIARADINEDGVVDIQDLVLLSNLIAESVENGELDEKKQLALNTIYEMNAAQFALKERNAQIGDLMGLQFSASNTMKDICEHIDKRYEIDGLRFHNFSDDDIKILNTFYRDYSYSNDNIVVTSMDDIVSQISVMQDLYESAVEELSQKSQPQIQYVGSIDNILAIAEYKPLHSDFSEGNFIRVGYDEEKYVKLRIVSITYNPLNVSSGELSITFSNFIHCNTDCNDFVSLLDNAISNSSSGSSSGGSGSVGELSDQTMNALLNMQWFNGKLDSLISQYLGKDLKLYDFLSDVYSKIVNLVDGKATGSIRNIYSNDNIGEYSTAIGYDCLASGNKCYAEGWQTSAGGYILCDCTGENGIITLESNHITWSSGDTLFVVYQTSYSIRVDNHVVAQRDVLSSDTSITYEDIGFYNRNNLEILHIGVPTERPNAFCCHSEGEETIATGSVSHSEGFCTKACGSNGTHAEGDNTIAIGDGAHAGGEYTYAKGTGAYSEGISTVAKGYAAQSEGFQTQACDYAHAECSNCKALGYYSHAEGESTLASESCSHSEGSHTESNGYASHAEGYGCESNGNESHAEGNNTKSNGIASHSEGMNTESNGNYSHSSGYGTKADEDIQFVCGKFNSSNANAIFAVGWGTDDNNRANVFEVLKDGTATLNGSPIVTEARLQELGLI